MSASVLNLPANTVPLLKALWDSTPPAQRGALHTAFNFCQHRKGYASLFTADEILMNADSTRGISSVRGDFFRFMERHIETSRDAHSMMEAIMTYGQMSDEEQEREYGHDS